MQPLWGHGVMKSKDETLQKAEGKKTSLWDDITELLYKLGKVPL